MPKFQQHAYIYPSGNNLEGHIKMSLREHTLCGISIDEIKEKSLEGKVRRLKRYIEDRAICPECETKFRVILAKKSKLVDEWS